MERIPYWNINFGVIVDVLSIPAFIIFLYGLYCQWRKINLGRLTLSDIWSKDLSKIKFNHLRSLMAKGIINPRLYQYKLSGISHGLLFWGMLLLFIGTFLVLLNVLFGLPVFKGSFNYWYMSFALDAAGAGAILGLLLLMAQRLMAPGRLRNPRVRSGVITVEIWLFVILITGFVVEGLRIAVNGTDPGSFVGNFLGLLLNGAEHKALMHQYVWWAHGLMAVAFVAYIPYSPLIHLVLSPLNAALADPRPGLKLKLTDFNIDDEQSDELPALGCSRLNEQSRKGLLDAASCVWCGRCHEVCPAAQTGKALSPKSVLTKFADFLNAERFDDQALIDCIGENAIYSCTTCALCMEVCPVYIDQPTAILKLRQHLAMEKAKVPEIMARAVNSLEARYHPFYGSEYGKMDWAEGIDVPLYEAGKTEFLLWIGCFITYEARAQKIARAMVKILEEADISFGILENPRCTGDPARQMGNDFLFSEIARQNIDDFSLLEVKKIITLCPHCFDTFVNYYPQLGGNYELTHHSVFLAGLMKNGRLKVNHKSQRITYHDPCYLGRHNNIFEEPRLVLSQMGELIEMSRSRKMSFCCGGGGGNYWAEEEGERINRVRAKEALDMNADIIATACPYCLLMLTDGLKNFTDEQKVFDIAELI